MPPCSESLILVAPFRPRALLTFAAGAGLVIGSAAPADAQPATGAELAVEVAAARHMLARSPGHGFRLRDVTLDPAFADSISAPGSPGRARRDSARTAALAAAVDARAAAARDSSSVHVLLSEPIVRGDTAAITATIRWPEGSRSRRGLFGYETVALTLALERGAWRVVRERQLGIS